MDSARWVMHEYYPIVRLPPFEWYWEIYTLNDTIIDNTVYRKVATRNICHLEPNGDRGDLNHVPDIDRKEYVFGGIREEGKKVWLLKFEQDFPDSPYYHFEGVLNQLTPSEEYLLYDFDISVGDTIHFQPPGSYTAAIDSFPDFNGMKTTRIVNYPLGTYQQIRMETLVEGIGSSYGFFSSHNSVYTELICFSSKGETILFGDNCMPCAGLVSTGNIESVPELIIAPNPADDFLEISSKGNLKEQINSVKIHSLSGQLLAEKEVFNQSTHLDISRLQPGIYFISALFENGYNRTQRIIKN